MPRGRRLSHPLNQYVNWVQAQPAVNRVRHHAAAAQASTGRLGGVVRNGSLLRGLFSYKSHAQASEVALCATFESRKTKVINFAESLSATWRLTRIKVDDFTPAAACDQQALPAGHPPPFAPPQKGGRKLLNKGSWSIKGCVLLRLFAAVKLPVDLRKDVLVHLLGHPVKVLDHLVGVLPLDVRRVARLDIALV